MATIGLGDPPRGPEFVAPGIDHRAVEPSAPAAAPPAARAAGRWPLLAAAGAVVIGVSAGTGGAAGHLAGRDDPAAAPVMPPAAAGTPADLVGAAARALPGVVSVQVRTGSGGGSGSGFVFDDRGHIVTNKPRRRRRPGRLGQCRRRGRAQAHRRDHRHRPGLRHRRAAGHPLPPRCNHWASRTCAPLGSANSGGPLVNARGEVLGVNTAIATLEGGGSIGIGFAVPIDRAQQVATTIIGRG